MVEVISCAVARLNLLLLDSMLENIIDDTEVTLCVKETDGDKLSLLLNILSADVTGVCSPTLVNIIDGVVDC